MRRVSRPRSTLLDVIGFILLGILATVLALGLVANSRWAAKRNWVFNRHNPRPSGSGIPQLLDEIYQPSVEHMIAELTSESTRAVRNESGDKPNADAPTPDPPTNET